jgi:putative addiction module component (TIGR02574 family)
MSQIKIDDINELSVAERLDLIERIWDTLDGGEGAPIPDWHQDVLDERLNDLKRNPEAGEAWDDVKKRIAKRP